MSPLLLAEKYAGITPPPAGRGHASITPYGPYTSKDSQEVQIAVQNDGQWLRLCREVLDRNDLAEDPNYATNSGRVADRARVEAEVSKAFGFFSASELVERLERADVPYGILREVSEVVSHPQLLARGRWTKAKTQAGTSFEALLPPFLSREEASEPRKVPTLGEHNDEILGIRA
jgi:crotonobetainyl-CoA:carnitine CoA-transferase CaiB-like acyl-CoA transferase